MTDTHNVQTIPAVKKLEMVFDASPLQDITHRQTCFWQVRGNTHGHIVNM